MATYRIDKDGKRTLVRESTRMHPQGARPRLQDGTHPTVPQSKPAQPIAPAKAAPDKPATKKGEA